MLSKIAASAITGLLTAKALRVYARYRAVNDFGKLTYQDAIELVVSGNGTVAQQERMVALAVAKVHLAADAQRLSGHTRS